MAIWQLCANLLIPNCLRSNLSFSPLAALELYVKKTNSWIDRQNILDPLQLYMQLNGAPEDLQLRFRNTILTTLDTGAGTSHQLS